MSSSQDILYVGAPIGVVLPDSPVSGFRIIPVLAAGSTWAQMLAAYRNLTVTVRKQSTNFLNGVVEAQAVAGADWIRSPGFGTLLITNAQNGVTYRVWIATDCKEMTDAVTPAMDGFSPSNPTSVGTVTKTDFDTLGTAAAPTLAGDGADFTAAKAVNVYVRAKNAAATLNAIGNLDAWAYSPSSARWIRIPDLDFVPNIATVEPACIGGPVLQSLKGVGRVAWVPNGCTVSAGTNVITSIEVLT